MDHSVKAMTSPRILTRMLNPHRFENDELEQLYQRYICKLQHSSVAAVVAIFVVLTALLANLGLIYAHGTTAQNVYHAAHCILFALLLGFLHTRFMQDAYLLWVCYVVLFFLAIFCALALPLYPESSTAKVAAEGTWQVVFVVFLAYAMMPLKSWIAAIFGFLLCCAHVTIATIFAKEFQELKWQQVGFFYLQICQAKWRFNNARWRPVVYQFYTRWCNYAFMHTTRTNERTRKLSLGCSLLCKQTFIRILINVFGSNNRTD
jgi:adenylate cyclase 1